jgi:hypothetical protein
VAIAFDAASEFERTGTTDPQTWTHTPTGTPRGVAVAIVHGTSTTDHVSTVTYGGVALTEVVRATDATTELGAAEWWYVGSGIPTGAQTVSVDLASATGDDIHFVCITFTAGANTEVVDFDSVLDNVANPSVTLQYGGRTCMAVGALYGGGAAPTSFTPNGNCVTVHDVDQGNFYSEVIRQSSPGSSDFAIGGTASSDDVAFAAMAVAEVHANVSVTAGVGALVAAGFASTVTATANQLVTAGLGALTLAGFAPTVTATANQTVTPGVGVAVVTGFVPSAGPSVRVDAALGTATLTGFAPTVTATANQIVTTGLGAATVAGLAPTVTATAHVSVTAGLGTLTATGQAPTVSATAHLTASAGLGTATLAGFAPTVSATAHVTASAGVGALAVSGFAPTASATAHVTASAGLGVLTLTGHAPGVAGGEGLTIATGLGSATLSGLAPVATATAHRTVSTGRGTLTLAGFSPAVSVSSGPVSVSPGTGLLTIVGYAPTASEAEPATDGPFVTDHADLTPDIATAVLAAGPGTTLCPCTVATSVIATPIASEVL